MKVVFLLTECPGAMCGVYDYTVKLAESIRRQGVAVEIDVMNRWSVPNLRRCLKKYAGQDACFHLQYPTLGMGNSVAPGLVPLLTAKPVFVTLHEFNVFNTLRKSIFLPHALRARAVILTNGFEQNQFVRFFPFSARKTTIIPIGNNIPVLGERMTLPRERIIYFGQISENKGIDFYVETIRALRGSGKEFDAAFIGSMLDENSGIARFVRDSAAALDIKMVLNLPSAEVSAELQKSTIALLPFPDGITEKRGSALACLAHGNTVITVHSGVTAGWLRETTHHAANAGDAAALIGQFMTGEKERHLNPDILSLQMAEREWDNIARRHIALYKT